MADQTARIDWPDIPFVEWRDTCAALHLYTQIAGKYRLAHTPWINHSWQATLYVTSRGLSTSMIPDGATGGIEVEFDLVNHAVLATAVNGQTEKFDLRAMSVAEFHAQFIKMIESLGGDATFHGRSNELPEPVEFAGDRRERPYDAAAVNRYFQALVRIDQVFRQFRTAFLGKVSPVHLFWGSFDLAVTRFSGRAAPPHPGGIPFLPDNVTREAYSHEVSSAGFWPGGGPVDYPAFYSYAYPAPNGFADAEVAPDAAFFEKNFGEFILPYDAVRTATNPEQTLLDFLNSTYSAAAVLGDWDRDALECEQGQPLQPRKV